MIVAVEEAWQARAMLRVGDAVAVVMSLPPGDKAARDEEASAQLRRATGRHDITILRRGSGRPCLAAPYPELSVSLARRRSLMLAGFSPTARVGVDLEIADTGTNIDPVRLAVDHLSTGEAARIAAAPPPEARDLFLRLWVAKEAVLKLTGRGVYDGMHKPDLALALDRLRQDGAEVELPSPDEQGALRLAVCRLAGPGSSACYGSLAVVSHSL